MHLECSVYSGSRNPIGGGRAQRPSAGYVGLGKYKQVSTMPETLWMFVKTQAKVNRYEINKNSLENIIGKMVSNGMATIQFRVPNINVYISKAAPHRLRRFLELIDIYLKNLNLEAFHMLNKEEENCKISQIKPQTKILVIESKDNYPKCFPTSLIELRVNGLKTPLIDPKWAQLSNLQCLDLSLNTFHMLFNNEKEWRKFALLRNLTLLKEFRFASNAIQKLPDCFFEALPLNLEILDLSKNKLKEFNNCIARLINLHTLNLSSNLLINLPEDLCLLKELKNLNVSFNHLRDLPPTIFNKLNYRRFIRLDIAGNPPLIHGRTDHNYQRLFGISILPDLAHIAAGVLLNNYEILDSELLPHFVNQEMRSWILRCSQCLQFQPESLYTYEVLSLQMSELSMDTYSGPPTLHIETNFCTKCRRC